MSQQELHFVLKVILLCVDVAFLGSLSQKREELIESKGGALLLRLTGLLLRKLGSRLGSSWLL